MFRAHVLETCRHEIKLNVKQILCIKLVKYSDKYTSMHGQQNVKKHDLQNFTASHSDTARTALTASCSLFLLALMHHHHTASLLASYPVARSAVCREAVTLNQPY